jgi:hypothetical protein
MGAMGIYQIFERFGAQLGGIANVQGPASPPSWLSYVQVADSSRAVSAAKAAGGRLLHGPMEVPGGSWIALFIDPQGGAFAVHEMPRAAVAKPATAPKPAPAPAATPAPAAKPAAAAPSQPARPAPSRPAKKAAKKAAKKKAARKKTAAKKVARRPARKAKAKRPARKAAKRTARRSARRAPARRHR